VRIEPKMSKSIAHPYSESEILFKYIWFYNSEQEKVKSYRQKISKWQGQVSERLQALSRRAGSYLKSI
jgi:hypothetical protein